MTTSLSDIRVSDVSFDKERMTVSLNDGRSIAVPLSWFPRLQNASTESLNKWESAAAGRGIHWPDLDEDLSVEGLLLGKPVSGVPLELRPR